MPRIVTCPVCGTTSEHSHEEWYSCPLCKKKKNHEKNPKTEEAKPQSVLAEAEAIINGPRRDAYGPVGKSAARLARVWSTILGDKLNADITAREAMILMAALKMCREMNAHSRDNCVDGAAYFDLANQVSDVS